MTEPAIIANMAEGWNRQPAAVALGSHRTEMSAALWTHDIDDVREVSAIADPSRYIISLPLTAFIGEMFFDGRRAWKQMVRADTCTLVATGSEPRAVHWGKWRILHLYLPKALVDGLVSSELSQAPSSVELLDPACRHIEGIDRVGRDVLAEMRADQPLSRLKIDLVGQELAIQLLRHCSNISARTVGAINGRGVLAQWQYNRVVEYLTDHIAQDISLAELAALVGLSPYHFCRAFKATAGLPPHRWRHQRRIERARELLEGTDWSITEVAAAIGYDDPSQLASAFRKALGVSPTRYRRERRL